MKTSAVDLEAMKEFGVAGFEAARSLSELNLRTWEKLVEKQAETFGLFADAGVELVKATAEAKEIKDLVTAEMAVAKQFGENVAAKSRETVQLTTEARDDYRSWLEQGFENFSKQVSQSVKVA